jgi:nitrous oxidase accessory protein NosD
MKRDYLKGYLRSLSIGVAAAVGIFLVLFFVLSPGWPEGSIFVPRDFPTLKEALEAVGPGGTIVLQAWKGTFHGPVVVTMDGITIASTGIASLEGEGGEPAITIRGDGVRVKGLRVTAPAVGISVEGADCTLDRIFVDSTPIGIRITSSSQGEFSSIRVEGSDTAFEASACLGTSFRDIDIVSSTGIGILLIDSRKNLISGVRIRGGRIGISLEGADENAFLAGAIEGCTEAGVRLSASNENRFANGSLTHVKAGIVIENAQGNVIADCRIGDADIGCSLIRPFRTG